MITKEFLVSYVAAKRWFVGIEMLDKYGTEWQIKTTNPLATYEWLKKLGLYTIKFNIVEVEWNY